ncbi:hypothetical protein FIBSPDRAFT_805134, partial [Athelia psychrophila]
MPLPLSWAIYLLGIALSDVAARAVDTNTTSLATSNISSSILSDSSNVTASSESCTDIKTCRTLDQIIVSCLVTILACVWFAVHRNVPAPRRKPSYHSNFFINSTQWAWSVILGQKEAAMVFFVALLAPEWILAWALRQALHRSAADHMLCQRCEGNGSWKRSHAFLVTMGGFNFHNEDELLYPLSPETVIELVQRGHLVPPTADEIANQSKGDALSKGVAIAQTLWFVVQCIARGAEHLPVTNLEAMTLAYTVMTVAMYVVWWDKPLNVSCAVRVPEEEVE